MIVDTALKKENRDGKKKGQAPSEGSNLDP